MKKTIIAISVLAAYGCATTQAVPEEDSRLLAKAQEHFGSYFNTGNPKWDACANEAVVKSAVEYWEENGDEFISIFGASGNGARSVAVEACGYAPMPDKLDQWTIDNFGERCLTDADYTDHSSHIVSIDPPAYNKMKADYCTKVYNSKEGIAARKKKEQEAKTEKNKLIAEKKALQAKPFRAVKVFNVSNDYAEVLIQIDKSGRVKCALLDSEKDPVAIDSSIITAPMDKILIRTHGASWSSVQCWRD